MRAVPLSGCALPLCSPLVCDFARRIHRLITLVPTWPTCFIEMIKPANQWFHSFLCLDVESTCINADDPGLENPSNLAREQLVWKYPNEIIEWPVILFQWRLSDGNWQLYEVDRFRRFVQPTWRPILSNFCKDLTGITQNDVNQASTFPQVLKDFDINFVKPHKLFTFDNPTVWVTDGPWDFQDHFLKSTFLSRIHLNNLPFYLKSPINIIDLRYLVQAFVPRLCTFALPPSFDLVSLLSIFGLEFEGRQHSGIDDVVNIGRLLSIMVTHARQPETNFPQWVFKPNRSIKLRPERFFWMSKKFKCTWTLP
ncbi:hypothetical protein O181_021427 [Austropuccinia psidii MF-1]|uniref:Exonuclease domain-containing protein n=1 Tax=Austropuccinia psidii MF-1 TaxID=1389203 RepID=A0A9Q3CFI0_9BASI|nr:hypothetical protein [Austropuccinia psidii MF-1]